MKRDVKERTLVLPHGGARSRGEVAGDGCSARKGAGVRKLCGELRPLACETSAQSTLEYAITTFAVLALIAGIAALWRAGEEGVFVELVEDAASHAFTDLGVLDISLY